MQYLTKSGKVLREPVRSHKVWSAILTCALAIGIGVGLRLVLDVHPGIIASILSILKNIGIAIWNMLCGAAHACAEFVHYVVNTSPK